MRSDPALGASYGPQATTFHVWAPGAQQVETHLLDSDRYITMQRDRAGYFTCHVDGVMPGARYYYRLDGEKERPDPASRSQPEGVHGPSQVVDPDFKWGDAGWQPPSLRNSVIYELHVGTFTTEGTFDAIINYLPYLVELGVTTLQIMPVAQFPGARNWGYDGVQLYAPHHDYGGVDGLKRLVNACHQQGLAVLLDVVYNHLGPEGNYLWDYGPYFTDRYHSAWGDSINLDGPQSDPVRRFFMENAVYWLDQFHIDGLRLDAIHALYDTSARPFVSELAAHAQDWAVRHNRSVHIIAESHDNDRRLTLSREANGLGLNAQWLDDLHHMIHIILTGEDQGYYLDYQDFSLLPKVLTESFAYTGQYSQVWQRRHGTSARAIPADRFIVSTQTHDQVGNRMLGERLSQLTDFDGLKLAAALMLCSPYVPMLFMGEEYRESAPFLYFISHEDPDLVKAVREGRAKEFAAFKWQAEPPDPHAETTFMRSKLDHRLHLTGDHAVLYALYRELIGLRRQYTALSNPDRAATRVYADSFARILCMERRDAAQILRIVMNFDLHESQTMYLPGDEAVAWQKIIDSNDAAWSISDTTTRQAKSHFDAGEKMSVTLAPKAFAIYLAQQEDMSRNGH
ncbi:MAG: malto-oligosyltrehalose trehalohydrolase [Anaerolineaceae bacterium]|nr:malto-oligosyltrehalose trehalohydrolase [Anaerolineaceae bacterium]